MARLIDATRIEQYILNNCSDNEEINAIYGEIINAPTADAEPIKHGRWVEDVLILNGIPLKVYRCTACGEPFWTNPPGYCPNCGAKMDEQQEVE